MATKAKSGKKNVQKKSKATKPNGGKAVNKPARKAANKAAKKPAKKPPGHTKQKPASVKSTDKKSAAKGNEMSKVKAGKPSAEKPPATTLPAESTAKAPEADVPVVDEYETQRKAAVEPFRRTGAAPKPGAAGRLFDDEAELEDYDPLFDDVKEENE